MKRKQQENFLPWRTLAAFAFGGGLLRFVSSFLDWTEMTLRLEALALLIDLGLLFGLSGLYFAYAARLGILGLAGYVAAASGVAFITGPQTQFLGADTYYSGVLTIAIGMVLFSAALLRCGVARIAAWLWLASTSIGVGASMLGEISFMVAGALFGLGFVAAGVFLWTHQQPN